MKKIRIFGGALLAIYLVVLGLLYTSVGLPDFSDNGYIFPQAMLAVAYLTLIDLIMAAIGMMAGQRIAIMLFPYLNLAYLLIGCYAIYEILILCLIFSKGTVIDQMEWLWQPVVVGIILPLAAYSFYLKVSKV